MILLVANEELERKRNIQEKKMIDEEMRKKVDEKL